MSELTQSDPAPVIADEESPDASRATGASLKVLQQEREWLQQLLVRQERRKWLREWLKWLQLLWLLFRRQRRGESNTDKSRREVALTKQQRRVLRDPEVRKNIEILAARACDAIDLNRRQSLPQEVTNRLSELLCEPRKALCLETLLDTRRSVEELLIDHSDLLLLQQRTAEEYAEEEATLLTWRRFYGGERPELLNLNYCSVSPSEQVQKINEGETAVPRGRKVLALPAAKGAAAAPHHLPSLLRPCAAARWASFWLGYWIPAPCGGTSRAVGHSCWCGRSGSKWPAEISR